METTKQIIELKQQAVETKHATEKRASDERLEHEKRASDERLEHEKVLAMSISNMQDV